MIATPTWGTSSSILEYHKESQDNYYRQEGDLGIWQGRAAKALGFTGAVTEKDLENALMGRNAEGTQTLKNTKLNDKGERERAGLDLTFNAPKSVSIAYELAKATGNEELAKTILDIHNNAVTKSLNGIENKYAQSRQTKDGVTEHIDTKNLAIAKFQHDTARPVTDKEGNVSVDPSLHTHAVIMNMTKSADGTYKAIESKEIFQHYMSEGMNYRATMAAELAKVGFEITITDENKGFYEISLTGERAKDEKLLESLSQRSEQIEKALPELREKYPNKSESELKQMAAHKTREFKGEIDRDKVRADNLQRAENLGMGVENINNLAQKVQRQKETVANMSPEQKEAKEFTDLHKAKDVVTAALVAITQEKSAFKMEDVTELSQKFLLSDAISPDILKKAIQEQLKDKSDLRLLNIGNKHYTTREILKEEKEVLDKLKESKDNYKPSHSKAAAKRELTEYSSKQTHSLTKGQLESAAHILSSKDLIIGIQGDAGTGKEQPISCIVKTLTGDKKLGDLRVGDQIYSRNGKLTKVTNIFYQGKKDVYEISFRDGSKTRAGANHNWLIINKKNKSRVLTTKELMELGITKRISGESKYRVPLCEPVAYSFKKFTLNPYVLGVFLGDGTFSGNTACLSYNEKDVFIYDMIKDIFKNKHGFTLDSKARYTSARGKQVALGVAESKWKNPILKILKDLGLNDKKHIPNNYLYGSPSQRIDLLRGLMDTDGSIRNNRISFSNTNRNIIDGVIHLVQSLGGVCIEHEVDKRKKNHCYTLNIKTFFNPFLLPNKAKKWKLTTKNPASRYITKIEKLEKQEEQLCISVKNKEHLYLTDNFIVTHNTTMLKAVNELKGDTKVYGLSYTGKAAKEIENATKEKQKEQSSDQMLKSSGIESATLASFLNKAESGKLDKAEFRGAKLIVDEASMLGIKDANKLLSFAKDAGAQVVMIGDVKQFKAINAGDPFSLLQNNNMETQNMSEVIRQKDKTLIAAVAQLNNYNTDKAFEILDKANMIHELKGNESVIDKIKEDYFAYHEKADKDKVNDTVAIASVKDTLKNNVILTQTNKVKDELNKTIRDEMKERELVSRDEFKFKTRESTGLTPAQKYFAANYKESTNIFLQDNIFVYDGNKVDKLEKGKEYEMQERDTKSNTLQVKDKEGNSFKIDLKKNSQAIQAYKETERSFSQGDKIVFEKNDKKIGIENGTIGKIQSVDKEGNITIKTEDKTVNFNMTNEYNYLNHGYAVTTYKAQGASADNVMAYMPAKGQNANSFYVTVTRAVENLKIYTDSKDDLRSAIHNEQIKDNAHSLNDRLERKEAARVQKQQEVHEQRKLSREEAFSNALSSKKQLSFAEGIAKELGIENPDIGKRANTDQFIKDNLEIYQASKEQKQLQPPSDKQAAFAQTIADKLYDDIDTSKMNVKQTKEYISANVEEFKDAVKNPVQHMLNVDVSKLSQVQEDKYFMDLVHTELVSAYKKDIDSLEKLDQKHEQVFSQISLEEKQMKLDLYATALDIKPKDYLDAMVKEHTNLQYEETIQKFGLNTPQGMAKELKDQGLIYQDEKYRAMADLIVERQFDKFMEKHDGTNSKEFEDRNARMIEFTESYKEQLTGVREYEGKISSIEEMLESGDIHKAVAMIEEHREHLEEYDLANLEKELEKVMESEFVHVQDELEKEFEIQEEFLSNELEEYDKTDDKEQDKDDEHIQEIEQDDKELDIATEDKQNDKEHIELEDEYDYDYER